MMYDVWQNPFYTPYHKCLLSVTPLPVLYIILESPAQPQKFTEKHNYFGPFQEQ